jgi:hypothetical protein
VAYNGRIIVKDELGRMWKEVVVTKHFTGATERNVIRCRKHCKPHRKIIKKFIAIVLNLA